MQQDEFTEIPVAERGALIHRIFKQDLARRVNKRDEAKADIDAAIGVFGDDTDRRVLFLADVSRRLVENGTQWTQRWLRRKFKFPPGAAREAIGEARRVLGECLKSSTEELRALAEIRLEDFMRRSRKAVDLDAEIKGLKEWLRLHGLLRIDPSGGGLGDIRDLMRKVCLEDASEGPIVDAEFEVAGNGETEKIDWKPPPNFRPEMRREDKDDEE